MGVGGLWGVAARWGRASPISLRSNRWLVKPHLPVLARKLITSMAFVDVRPEEERQHAAIAAAEAASEHKKLAAQARPEAKSRTLQISRPRKMASARKNSAVDMSAVKTR